jgi:hypothetical protein
MVITPSVTHVTSISHFMYIREVSLYITKLELPVTCVTFTPR